MTSNTPPSGISGDKQALGLAMSLFGGLLLTVDAPLLRLAGTDAWTVVTIRGIFAFSAMFAFWAALRMLGQIRTPFVNGYLSVGLSCLTALASVLFVNAIHMTSVANVVFILAFNPMFAALLSWLLMGEKPNAATLLAMLTSFIGVLIIVSEHLSVPNSSTSFLDNTTLIGDLLAVAACFTIATILTLARRSGTDQSMSPAVGSLLAAVAVAPFAQPASLSAESWGWLAINGLIVIPLSSALMLLGPRYLAASIVAMFFLLETVLTPIWMWMIFGEAPTERGLLGGAVIFATLMWHSFWTLHQGHRTNQRAR